MRSGNALPQTEHGQSALFWLLALALVRLLLHTLTNGQYGFHRDELATLADARHLDWGFPAYPPLTPFVARVAMDLLGQTSTAVRFFAALAQTVGMIVTGLIAREFGGNRQAQITAALAAFAAPVSVAAGHLFQYVSFDYLWCVLTVYFVIRLLRTEDLRWWLAVGVTIGLGFLTRYTIAWLAAGLLFGFLLTPSRRVLASRWFAAAIGVVILIVLPSLLWQVRHNFLALEFTSTIHARDIRIGRADGFLWKQFIVPASAFTIPLWVVGLFWLFRSRWRPIAWTFVIAVALFAAARARDYYSAPLYPMLLAAGAVALCRWPGWAQTAQWCAIGVGILTSIALVLPVSPINSTLFKISTKVSGDPVEEIGWPELTAAVAKVYDDLPEADRPHAGIFTGNYGEAGALALFGPAHHLPQPISRANSFWMRGYPDPPPETLIVLGISNAFAAAHFVSCETKMTFNSPLGIDNEENGGLIRVCRGLKEPWPEFWRKIRVWT